VAYPDFPAGTPKAYVYTNPPLATSFPGITDGTNHTVVDINHWQRLLLVSSVDQNGFPSGPVQLYLAAQSTYVRPFSLIRPDPTRSGICARRPPYFGGAAHEPLVKEAAAVHPASTQLPPDDGAMIAISPGAIGNNTLDFVGDYGNGNFNLYDGHGYPTNPV